MDTITGLRALDPRLPAAGWPGSPAAGGLAGPSRWLDGLAAPDGGTLTADVPPGAAGLDAAGHAQRVLAALLGDELG